MLPAWQVEPRGRNEYLFRTQDAGFFALFRSRLSGFEKTPGSLFADPITPATIDPFRILTSEMVTSSNATRLILRTGDSKRSNSSIAVCMRDLSAWSSLNLSLCFKRLQKPFPTRVVVVSCPGRGKKIASPK